MCVTRLITGAAQPQNRVLTPPTLPGPGPQWPQGAGVRGGRLLACPTYTLLSGKPCGLQVGCTFTYLGALVSFSTVISKRTASGRRRFQE